MSDGQGDRRRTTAMERKKKQREQEEAKKRQLQEVVRAIMPPGWVSQCVANKRKRRLTDTNGVLEDIVQCVKHVRSSTDQGKRDNPGQPSHQGLASTGWGRYRAGMGLSKTVGTMLVHKED
eukprot:CAMPEP_0173402026 /NCGR_PEP_ID=MMETSP1356-20130122/52726_1 /TAXON_ID=77927 ORGANISM="Hemiselmis virescens, Strain PCC157" /NCGR_SAMPLE_ID=MMETSP1356 /ASSEMBLY_ACC=CAM_ASM_000847 /LENGTH=120 /DNA_ID=CAMNT_0014362299 /DNA_START=79 /DNA_END=438 /DNA_ORIENTATION=+